MKSFTLQFPDANTRLPTQSGPSESVELNNYETDQSPCIQDISTPGRGLVGMIQACWLVDRILHFIEQPTSTNHSEGRVLDDDLRTFMNAIFELEANGGGCCAAIAIIVRGMFMYHAHVVQMSRGSTEEKHVHDGASMALQTTARIMVDVAQSRIDRHCLTNIDEAFPTCRYDGIVALKFLEEYEQKLDHQEVQVFNEDNKAALRELIAAMAKRWQAVDA